MKAIAILTIALFACSFKQGAQDAAALVCGTWKVNRIIPTNGVHGDVVKGFVGASIVYSASEMLVGARSVARAPNYSMATKTRKLFFVETFVDLPDLGVMTTEVAVVTVTSGPNHRELHEPGDMLIVRNKDTLITTWAGVFYELTRVKGCGK